MTDLNRSSDDELVSAVLDGEASAEDVARVEADPRLRLQLEQYRRISAAIAAPVPTPNDAQRESLLAAALAAATQPEVEAEADTASGNEDGAAVIPLHRSRRTPPAYLIGVAAAAVVLLLLAVPLALRDGGRGTSNDQTAAATTLVDDVERAADQAAGAEAPAADTVTGTEESFAPSEATPLSNGDDDPSATATVEDSASTVPLPAPGATEMAVDTLGDFASREEATVAVTLAVIEARDADRRVPTPPISAGAADLRSISCLEEILTRDPELDALAWTGSIGLPDGEHQLLLFRLAPDLGTNGEYRLYEILTSDCSVVTEETLD